MSDWELHDFSVQVVRDRLKKEGKNVFSSQSSCTSTHQSGSMTEVNCSQQKAPRPENLAAIATSCARMSPNGYFASVTAANPNDPFTADKGMPLYRGHGLYFRYEELVVKL
jgi:hypothetical protein